MKHYSTTYNFEAPIYKDALKANCIVLHQLFKNNSYLLKRNGLTLYRQIKDLNDRGLHLDYGNTHKLKSGKLSVTSLTYLNFISGYWGKTLIDMLSVDYEAEDQRLSEIG